MLQLMLDNREIELRRQRDQNKMTVRVSRRKLTAEFTNHVREMKIKQLIYETAELISKLKFFTRERNGP